MEELNLNGKEGRILSAARYTACSPKAVVQIVHGIAEHKERYYPFCEYLQSNGYSVYIHDHRGHGSSAGKDIGYTAEKNGWQILTDEVRIVSETARKENPGRPLFLFGHSMGSFIVRTEAIQNSRGIDGMIVCATAGPMPLLSFIGEHLAGLQKLFAGGKKPGYLMNKLSFGGYEKFYGGKNWLSRNKAVVDEYNNDPLCGFIPSLALFENLLYGTRYINRRKNIRKMRKDLPVLLIAGSGDPVGNFGNGVAKVNKMFRETGLTDLEFKLYPEARHELLNEFNKEEVYNDILTWLNRHVEERK